MGFSRQKYWIGLLFPVPGDFPHLGIEPALPHCRQTAGSFFITSATWEAIHPLIPQLTEVHPQIAFPWKIPWERRNSMKAVVSNVERETEEKEKKVVQKNHLKAKASRDKDCKEMGTGWWVKEERCFEEDNLSVQFSLVQSFSHVWLSATSWITAHQASLSITNSRSLLKFMPIKSVMPSSHPFLCHPLLLLPTIPPSIRVFSNESTLHPRWPKYWSFSFIISPSNEHPGLISFRTDWLDLLAVQETLKSLLQLVYHQKLTLYFLKTTYPRTFLFLKLPLFFPS